MYGLGGRWQGTLKWKHKVAEEQQQEKIRDGHVRVKSSARMKSESPCAGLTWERLWYVRVE
jgi:hypothetical protein